MNTLQLSGFPSADGDHTLAPVTTTGRTCR